MMMTKVGRRFLGSCALKSIKNNANSGFLQVTWNDGKSGAFPYVWLRDNAPEPGTVKKTERICERVLVMGDLSLDVAPLDLKMANDGEGIDIKWYPDKENVNYASTWLRERNLSDGELRQNRKDLYKLNQVTWGSDIGQIISPAADWNKMMQGPMISNGYLLEQLRKLLAYGILHVVNVPKQAGMLDKFNDLLGYAQNTQYGWKFTVKSDPNPSNLAYTHQTLDLHTDLPYMASVPEVQMLHCIKQCGMNQGGESQFVDGFRIAELLKEEEPEAYHLLTTVPIEFIDKSLDTYKSYMALQRKSITLDDDGKPASVFMSTMHRTWMMDTNVENVPKVYRALKLFHQYCYQKRNLFATKLNEGEIMIFFNTRVLHGRTGFDPTKVERHLEGGYFNFDIFRSAARLIEDQLGTADHVTM